MSHQTQDIVSGKIEEREKEVKRFPFTGFLLFGVTWMRFNF
jgi:hypothetical protein